MQHHKAPLDIFCELIHLEVTAGVEDCPGVLGLVRGHADQKSQGIQVQALIPVALRCHPGAELGTCSQ